MSNQLPIRAWAWVLVALAGLGISACASATSGAATQARDSAIVVENNLIPPATVSIYAAPAIGVRRLIGTVAPGATQTLEFDAVGAPGEYRFVADVLGGRSITSNSVVLPATAVVQWSLTSNIATVTAAN